jgi:dihydroorotase
MPNTDPVTDNEQTVKYIINKAKEDGYVRVYPIGAISKGQKGGELSEIGELKFAGAVAISDDGKPVASPSLMKKALMYSNMFDMPVISHCEDSDLAENGDMNEGYNSTIMGLRGIPSITESIQVARDVLLSEYTDVPVHIAHVSTASSVHIIRDAKKRGVKVTCETCPHYFTLNDDACLDFNTHAKVNPPLALESDRLAIIEGLKDGTIDIIATDHAPHHRDEKNIEFSLASNGIIGFETAFGLAYTMLVKPGHLTLSDLVEKMSVNPAKLLRLVAGGSIENGRPADITIVDTEKAYKVDVKSFKSKAANSPFDGYELTGAVEYTIVGGNVVVCKRELMD